MLHGAHQANSNQSELFKSMKAYLNSTNRLQPFIGLSSIIECVNGGTDQRDAFYLCEVCVCRLDKADMRNHIMGGLHRYNYIKTRHPDLVSDWREVSSRTKLAWPLMDIAKRIEEKEGPGNVQVVEFDKSSYQQMESQSNAKIVISFLRHTLKDSEPESSASFTSNSPSNRIVLYSPRKNLEKSSKKEVYILPQDNHSLTQQTSKVSESSKDLLTDTSHSSFLSGCTEPVPLIGLSRVVECKSEDGQTYCFLCHCCRVRSHKHDVIHHLTSSSHITNYLMETHPEQLQSLDMNDNYQLDALVKNLKQEENTKEIKVVQLPESLCVQMTGKSYHWCVKTLAWNNSDFPVKYVQVKRQKLHQKPFHRSPKKFKKAVQIKQGKKKKKVRRSKDNPVFRVMLPVTQGSLLVERTAFSKDDPPLPLSYSPSPPECAPSPSKEPQYSQDAQDYKSDWPLEILDSTPPPEDTSPLFDSQYQPNDFFPANENVKQEMDYKNEHNNGQWFNQGQNVDCKTDMHLNVAMSVQNYNVKNGFGPPPPPRYNEYWPQSFSGQEKQGCPIDNPVGNPYYQPASYMLPDTNQHFSGGPFSNNNNMNACTDRTQASYYPECGGNIQQYSSSYQVSSSASWGTYQLHSSGQCYGPCCAPAPPLPLPSFSGASFLGGISGNNYEPAPSNSMCYPMPDFYPSQGCPY